MIIGQIEQMKIAQIDAGLAALNTISPIGSQASGDTGFRMLMTGLNMPPRNLKRPIRKPSGMPVAAGGGKPLLLVETIAHSSTISATPKTGGTTASKAVRMADLA